MVVLSLASGASSAAISRRVPDCCVTAVFASRWTSLRGQSRSPPQLCWRPPTLTPNLDPDPSSRPERGRLGTEPIESATSSLPGGIGSDPTEIPHTQRSTDWNDCWKPLTPTVPTCAALCFYERKQAFLPESFTSFQVKVVSFPLHRAKHL